MTRPLRLEFPGAVYHLTARGDRRGDIFLDDTDRQTFLRLLEKEVRQQAWRLFAYCLMSNHYHLLVETPDGNLVAGMRRLNGAYTQAFNRRHGRVGHVLQGRYKSIVVDRDAYLLELARYIVLNPVRANMVKRVEDWPMEQLSCHGRQGCGCGLAGGGLAGEAIRRRDGCPMGCLSPLRPRGHGGRFALGTAAQPDVSGRR